MPNNSPFHARDTAWDYVLWGLICLAVSIVGFWPSYLAPLAAGEYRSPSPMMPWHVLCTYLWLVLLVVQPLLIQGNRYGLHRRLGYFGLLVALGVVFTGIFVQLDVLKIYVAKGDEANSVPIPFIRFTLLLGFAVCVCLAIFYRRRSDWHQRLMLLGTFPLMQSAFDRMTANVLDLPGLRGLAAMLGQMLLMFLFAAWDRWRLGRFHPVTWWGTILLALFYFFSPAASLTQWWANVARTLAS